MESTEIKVVTIEYPDDSFVRSYGGLTYDDGVEVLEDILRLSHHVCHGIQTFGKLPRRVDIALDSKAFYSSNVQCCLDEKYRLDNDKVIVVSLPNMSITEVYIRYVPMEWGYERCKRIFGFYVDIKKMEKLAIKRTDVKKGEYAGKPNGNIRIRMKMRQQMPSSLSIDGRNLL